MQLCDINTSAEWAARTVLAFSLAMLVQAKAAAMWQLLRQRQRPPLLEAGEIKGCPNGRQAGIVRMKGGQAQPQRPLLELFRKCKDGAILRRASKMPGCRNAGICRHCNMII